MWRVLFILTALTASCEAYKKHKTAPSRNQRIIKVQGPPYFNNFYGHPKPVRKRPFGGHHGDEFVRPKHPPPIPPFFAGPSTNHIKHLQRPPPHVFHKSPSYGLGFPYKSLPSFRPTISKEKFRVQPIPVRPAVSTTSNTAVSSSTTFHSPAFISSNSFPNPHIITSDDNSGPIREIPAPNLAPKPHETSFGTISVVTDGGLGGVGDINAIGGIGVSEFDAVKIHGVNNIGAAGGVLHADITGGGIHNINGAGSIQGVTGIGTIHGVGGSGSIHGVSGSGGVADISNVASVGGVTHLEPEALLHTVAKNPNGVNLDAIVKDEGLEVNTYIKESSGDPSHGKEPTVEIANFDEGSSIDVTNLIKDAAGMSEHHSTYKVTEHHNHLPSNDQIIKGHDGTNLYYAPDPDPSLPVHKVPPTNDPHSTPSNGQSINSIYIPHMTHGFSYLPGAPVGGHLSSQELYHLMHGYPVISQPVVAFTPGVIISSAGHGHFQQAPGTYGGDHYAQNEQPGNDISQYLQQPEIHNLIHSSESQHEAIGGSHSSVVRQSLYSPQNYPQSQYSPKDTALETNSGTEINHNYQYEPEASETDNRNSFTVIRQASEGTLNSETVRELLLEDSAANELKHKAKDAPSESITTILQLKNVPEVPFYASLPSKEAAEALAKLQAAGSVASDYINKVKIMRGDQEPEEEQTQQRLQQRRRKLESGGFSSEGRLTKGELVELGSEKTVVEIQKSLPLYETSITSKNLVEEENVDSDVDFSPEGQGEDDIENSDFKEDEPNETFGKRIRPK